MNYGNSRPQKDCSPSAIGARQGSGQIRLGGEEEENTIFIFSICVGTRKYRMGEILEMR